MITLSLLVCISGLVVWIVFSKSTALADALIAEAGRLSFFGGGLAYLLNIGMKTL